ncbi:hypothetical protein MAR_020964 [Mya arenaria]|uniref:Uncharacterized protein n=1 Tax=Mya arenaria TaxID=6604 RepID=A0ABY7E6V6_MYAAR|nr:hypothetical protein MAR_020964 [Mya arenaria]
MEGVTTTNQDTKDSQSVTHVSKMPRETAKTQPEKRLLYEHSMFSFEQKEYHKHIRKAKANPDK